MNPLVVTLSALLRQSTVKYQYSQSKIHVHEDIVLNYVNGDRDLKKKVTLQELPASYQLFYTRIHLKRQTCEALAKRNIKSWPCT